MSLTREDILEGRIEKLIIEAERLGHMTRLCPQERRKSKQAALAQFGDDDEIWLFGYGSLMWNPCIHYADRQPGLVRGYHRNFCLRTSSGRGSPECAGLVLALEPGGSCRGMAFRVEREIADFEMDVVWNREMVSGAYRPRIVKALTPIGLKRAITFVINRDHPRYHSGLSLQETAAMISAAKGHLGTCAEYLFNTVKHLDELGVSDGPMHALMRLVKVQLQQN